MIHIAVKFHFIANMQFHFLYRFYYTLLSSHRLQHFLESLRAIRRLSGVVNEKEMKILKGMSPEIKPIQLGLWKLSCFVSWLFLLLLCSLFRYEQRISVKVTCLKERNRVCVSGCSTMMYFYAHFVSLHFPFPFRFTKHIKAYNLIFFKSVPVSFVGPVFLRKYIK